MRRMRGATLVLLASLSACSLTTTHQHTPPPEPTEPTEVDPAETGPAELPAINAEQVGVWESRPRIAGGDEAPERYVLGSDGRFVWQAAHHGDPEAHPEEAAAGYERFGRWGSTDNGLVLREERRLVSELAFAACPDGEEQCECRECDCDACTDAEAEGECPCEWQSAQRVAQDAEDVSLAVADCPEDVLERVQAEQNEEPEGACQMLGETPFWHYADADDADLRVQDAWGTASIQ